MNTGLVHFCALSLTLSLNGCDNRRHDDAAAILRTMPIEHKVGQMIMAGVPGSSIDARSRHTIRAFAPGGVIFFGFNIRDDASVRRFIADLQRESMAASGIPLFVSVDQEGGRVKRLGRGVTDFPGAMAFGAAGDHDLIRKAARITGMELRLLGFNMNLAPVLDINNNPANPVINTRSFGSRAECVSRLGTAYIAGLQQSRCVAVGKHFPGHGDTSQDSHKTLPVINHDMNRLEQTELAPFREAVSCGVEAIMTAHIAFPKIRPATEPATLSHFFLTDILRTRFNFKGLVISDDMEMDAIARRMSLDEAAVRSIEAGADIVLVSSYERSIPKIYRGILRAVKEGRISRERIDRSVARILEVKLRYRVMERGKEGITAPALSYDDDERNLVAGAEKLNMEISRRALYLYGRDDAIMKKIAAGHLLPIILSGDAGFKKAITAAIRDCAVISSLGEWGSAARKKPDRSPVLVYQVDRLSVPAAKSVIRYAEKNGIPLLLVSTGNPFPLAALRPLPLTLFSFSNTPASFAVIADCIRGGFAARRTIDIDLALDE